MALAQGMGRLCSTACLTSLLRRRSPLLRSTPYLTPVVYMRSAYVQRTCVVYIGVCASQVGAIGVVHCCVVYIGVYIGVVHCCVVYIGVYIGVVHWCIAGRGHTVRPWCHRQPVYVLCPRRWYGVASLDCASSHCTNASRAGVVSCLQWRHHVSADPLFKGHMMYDV